MFMTMSIPAPHLSVERRGLLPAGIGHAWLILRRYLRRDGKKRILSVNAVPSVPGFDVHRDLLLHHGHQDLPRFEEDVFFCDRATRSLTP